MSLLTKIGKSLEVRRALEEIASAQRGVVWCEKHIRKTARDNLVYKEMLDGYRQEHTKAIARSAQLIQRQQEDKEYDKH